MKRHHIGMLREASEEFCRWHHIRRLAFFGSVLREDFHLESDVDVLVEFAPGHTPGLSFFAMEELSRILGRKMDLNTPLWLSERFREEVQSEAEVAYIAARARPSPASCAGSRP
jgi:uncharacterized protein